MGGSIVSREPPDEAGFGPLPLAKNVRNFPRPGRLMLVDLLATLPTLHAAFPETEFLGQRQSRINARIDPMSFPQRRKLIKVARHCGTGRTQRPLITVWSLVRVRPRLRFAT